jgi:hypothetical protein
LANVCEKYADYILKVLKVPFTTAKPDDSGFVQHATAEYDILTELEEKESSKNEDEKPKDKLTKEQRKEMAKKKEEVKTTTTKDEKKETKTVKGDSQAASEKLRITIFKK